MDNINISRNRSQSVCQNKSDSGQKLFMAKIDDWVQSLSDSPRG